MAGRFKIRFGRLGKRISVVKAGSIVDARRRFKQLHPNAKIDSTELIRRRR